MVQIVGDFTALSPPATTGGNRLHVEAPSLPASAMSADTFTVWGLSVRDLHDAFWRSKGVQCIRRGETQPLQSAAELYLLLDPSQMVIFELSSLSDRLTWRDAAVTRLRLIHEGSMQYSERVVVDDGGLVCHIERRYRPDLLCSSRIMMTPSRRLALEWMQSGNRREGLRRIRRAVRWSHVDHCRGKGWIFCDSNPQDQRRVVEQLVQRWSCPAQAIEGIEELETGVWHRIGDEVSAASTRIGPLWIGCNANGDGSCLVGPAFIPDRPDAAALLQRSSATKMRDIDEVIPLQTAPEPLKAQTQNFERGIYPPAKRAIDVVASAAALVLLSPVMLLVAALILIDDGRPLFFGHRRQGKGGHVFRCWKFRTMRRGADRMAQQFAASNVCDGPQIYIKNDPRVTRIGRILRATNLDELPQFWNVLMGQMSLVGPRPSPDNENQYCPAWRELRLSVRPGVTGLWQLNRTRRKGADFQEWIRYDILYVHHASLWLDLFIIFRTALLLLGWRTSRATAQTN